MAIVLSDILDLPQNEAGRYNEVVAFFAAGTYTWQVPSDIDAAVPVLVHVWGAGGACGLSSVATGNATGGGGGGLAVKSIAVDQLGTSVAVTVGAGATTHTGAGGTSSFGALCSATGGNSGSNASGNGTGGVGTGGDVNRSGGAGTSGSLATTGWGGGGGSAPAPYGPRNGFPGGTGTTRAGGGGASIAFAGAVPSRPAKPERAQGPLVPEAAAGNPPLTIQRVPEAVPEFSALVDGALPLGHIPMPQPAQVTRVTAGEMPSSHPT
jgi:hypothetical protein